MAQRLPESSLHQCFPASSVGNLVGHSKPSSHHLWALPAAARTSKKTSKNLRIMKTAKMRWKDQRLVTVKPWQRYFWCCVTAQLDKHRSIMFFLNGRFLVEILDIILHVWGGHLHVHLHIKHKVLYTYLQEDAMLTPHLKQIPPQCKVLSNTVATK